MARTPTAKTPRMAKISKKLQAVMGGPRAKRAMPVRIRKVKAPLWALSGEVSSAMKTLLGDVKGMDLPTTGKESTWGKIFRGLGTGKPSKQVDEVRGALAKYFKALGVPEERLGKFLKASGIYERQVTVELGSALKAIASNTKVPLATRHIMGSTFLVKTLGQVGLDPAVVFDEVKVGGSLLTNVNKYAAARKVPLTGLSSRATGFNLKTGLQMASKSPAAGMIAGTAAYMMAAPVVKAVAEVGPKRAANIAQLEQMAPLSAEELIRQFREKETIARGMGRVQDVDPSLIPPGRGMGQPAPSEAPTGLSFQ